MVRKKNLARLVCFLSEYLMRDWIPSQCPPAEFPAPFFLVNTGNTSQVNQEQVEVLTGAVYYALARILLPESHRGTRSPWERNRERRVVWFIYLSSCSPHHPSPSSSGIRPIGGYASVVVRRRLDSVRAVTTRSTVELNASALWKTGIRTCRS